MYKRFLASFLWKAEATRYSAAIMSGRLSKSSEGRPAGIRGGTAESLCARSVAEG